LTQENATDISKSIVPTIPSTYNGGLPGVCQAVGSHANVEK